MNGSADFTPGVVELREDVPLKAGASGEAAAGGSAGACCAGGPRLILACFAALTAAITLALFTQIYYGDYEVVPHGGVSSDAAACSGAGTDALKAGGRALDAAAAAALCLAVLAPHLTSLDASGSMLYWEYRQARARSQQPALAEWGAQSAGEGASARGAAPRLLAALAALHAQHGALPWARVLQPSIALAKNGFVVSESLAAALASQASGGAPPPPAGSLSTAPQLAAYLESLQRNTSAELAAAWGGAPATRAAATRAAGAWRVAAPPRVQRALALALDPPPADPDDASGRVISALQREAAADAAPAAASGGVGTGLAVVDSSDTYVALVTYHASEATGGSYGLSVAFGSGAAAAAAPGAGWTSDAPAAPLDLAPAILLDDSVCGTRYVLGGASGAALAQAAAALAAGAGARAGVERARVRLLPGGALQAEAAPRVLTRAVNVVQQRADALLTHADSRGGGLASRF